MNKNLTNNIIPDQLNITIRTSVPGYQKIEYKPSMTIKDIDEKSVRFNPLIKLNKSLINKIPAQYKIKQFFNKGLFQSLLNYNGGTPLKNIIQAKYDGYIDNNIKVTLETIFPTNSVIYIGKNPYVIGDIQWTSGDWKLEVKQKKEEIDLNKITDPRLYGELLNEEIIKGVKQLSELPKDSLTGNNYNGPPVIPSKHELSLKEEELTVKEVIKEPTKEESQELVPFLKESKELVPIKQPILPVKQIQLNEPVQRTIEEHPTNLLQLENKPFIQEIPLVEEITPEEEKIHDIIKENLKYSIEDTKFLTNYFKSNAFYNISNSLYYYFTKQQKNMIIDFYKLTTNTLIKPNTINLNKTAYNNLVDRISIIKTKSDGDCFFEAVATGINIHNMENIQYKITYANYGIKQIFTIQMLRELVVRYINNFTIEEKNRLIEIANFLSDDINKAFEKQIKDLNLTNQEYMENVNAVYFSTDNFLVNKPTSIPIDVNNYYTPFKTVKLNEIERYIKSKDYWANQIAIDAVCNTLKINVITIEKNDQLIRIPYLNFKNTRLCKRMCMFLFYKSNHYDLIRFNYNRQLIQEKDMIKKLLNIKKYYTIFNINHTPPPFHILALIFGSYYCNLSDKEKDKFDFYKNIMEGFNSSIKKNLLNSDEKEYNVFMKYFNYLFPGSNLFKTNVKQILQGGQSYLNNNILTKKPEERETSKIAYSIVIDMELHPGTSLTPEQIKESKCTSKYNMIRKAYSEFIGKPYVIPPVYNKTVKKNDNTNSLTKKNKNS